MMVKADYPTQSQTSPKKNVMAFAHRSRFLLNVRILVVLGGILTAILIRHNPIPTLSKKRWGVQVCLEICHKILHKLSKLLRIKIRQIDSTVPGATQKWSKRQHPPSQAMVPQLQDLHQRTRICHLWTQLDQDTQCRVVKTMTTHQEPHKSFSIRSTEKLSQDWLMYLKRSIRRLHRNWTRPF